MYNKLAIILGRGVEGAGVSTFAKELNEYYKNSTVFIYNEKKWQAGNVKIFRESVLVYMHNIEKYSKIINTEYDVVLYMSLPPKKHISEEAKEYFKKYLIDKITSPYTYYSQNDHHIQSINRNSFVKEVCDKVDGIFSFSITSTLFTKYAPGMYNHKFLPLVNGYDFSQNFSLVEDTKVRTPSITYLGRYAKFKNPQNLLSLAKHDKISKNVVVQLIGCAKTIECYQQLLCNSDGTSRIANKEIHFKLHYNTGDNLMHIPGIPYIYGAYKSKREVFEYISDSMFGCSFYNFPSGIDGNNVEYAQLEMISLGLVPLFSKQFAMSHRIKSSPIISYSDSGVYLSDDMSDIDECVDKIMHLLSDTSEAEKYAQNAYELYYHTYDSKFAFKKMCARMNLI